MSDTHDADDFSGPLSDARDAQKSPCDEYAVTVLRYLDNDLEGQELEEFRSHLDSCANCQSLVEQERALSKLLDRSRPLYSAPSGLRARVSGATLRHFSSTRGANRFPHSAFQALVNGLTGMGRRQLRVLAPAALAIALCLAFVPNMVRNVRAASYVETAVAEHRSHLDGSLPAGLVSNSPQQVTAWFANKVPFDFRLPAAEPGPENKPAYRLTGASVVHYKGSPAALVRYETQNEKITLLAVSSNSAVVAAGDEVRFGKLTFHYHTNSGFRVITWSTRGLSYALVSSVSAPARESCLVCHENMTDKGAFKAR